MTGIRSLRGSLSVLLLVLLAACASTGSLDMAALESAEIRNLRAPEGRVLSSGQPSQQQIEALAAAGVRHVINLRTPGEEVDFNERQAVEAQGMQYHSIPVAGAAGVTSANAQSLDALLAQIGDEPVLVHCASGNRVGGLMAIRAFNNGSSLEAAMAEGTRWGMTSEGLQQAVRGNLADN